MSGTIAFPPNPTVGQTYQFGGATWVWNGTVWTIAGASQSFIVVGPNAPSATNTGQLWWNTNDGQLYIWTGTAWTVTVNPPIPALSAVPQNYVDNSGFTINQRGYVTGDALAAGIYGFDRWKAGASGAALNYVATPASTIVNIYSGSIQQVIEGINLQSAPYTLSWVGGAQGRISVSSGGGTYTASPIQFTATGNTNTFIEFTGGNVSAVQLQLGTAATPWQPQPAMLELARCLRFFIWNRLLPMSGYNSAGGGETTYASFPVTMRAPPTVNAAVSGTPINAVGGNPAVTAITVNGASINAIVSATGAYAITMAWNATAEL